MKKILEFAEEFLIALGIAFSYLVIFTILFSFWSLVVKHIILLGF